MDWVGGICVYTYACTYICVYVCVYVYIYTTLVFRVVWLGVYSCMRIRTCVRVLHVCKNIRILYIYLPNCRAEEQRLATEIQASSVFFFLCSHSLTFSLSSSFSFSFSLSLSSSLILFLWSACLHGWLRCVRCDCAYVLVTQIIMRAICVRMIVTYYVGRVFLQIGAYTHTHTHAHTRTHTPTYAHTHLHMYISM